jgi:hypothetical protein
MNAFHSVLPKNVTRSFAVRRRYYAIIEDDLLQNYNANRMRHVRQIQSSTSSESEEQEAAPDIEIEKVRDFLHFFAFLRIFFTLANIKIALSLKEENLESVQLKEAEIQGKNSDNLTDIIFQIEE